jgi:hypothetical protein
MRASPPRCARRRDRWRRSSSRHKTEADPLLDRSR